MSKEIRIVAVKGSVRPGNYTSMALDLVVDEMNKADGVSVEVIDPSAIHLPLPGQTSDDPRISRNLQQRYQARHREPWDFPRDLPENPWPFSVSRRGKLEPLRRWSI